MNRASPDEAKSEEFISSSPKERFLVSEASLGRWVVVHDGTLRKRW